MKLYQKSSLKVDVRINLTTHFTANKFCFVCHRQFEKLSFIIWNKVNGRNIWEEEEKLLVWEWKYPSSSFFFPSFLLMLNVVIASLSSPPKHCMLFIESGIAIISHLLSRPFFQFFFCILYFAPSSKCSLSSLVLTLNFVNIFWLIFVIGRIM